MVGLFVVGLTLFGVGIFALMVFTGEVSGSEDRRGVRFGDIVGGFICFGCYMLPMLLLGVVFAFCLGQCVFDRATETISDWQPFAAKRRYAFGQVARVEVTKTGVYERCEVVMKDGARLLLACGPEREVLPLADTVGEFMGAPVERRGTG
jgi:hypothetical protein